jgi:hypothetical protein
LGILLAGLVRSTGGALCVLAAAIGLLLSATLSASATTTYEYTGNPFTTFMGNAYTSADHVTASFTLQDPIPANASNLDLFNPACLGPPMSGCPVFVAPLKISDGLQTFFRNAQSPLLCQVMDPIAACGTLVVSTDAMGRITSWNIGASTSEAPGIFFGVSTVSGVEFGKSDAGEMNGCVFSASTCASASNQGVPGTWTVTPEPRTATLLAMALVLLGCSSRKATSSR